MSITKLFSVKLQTAFFNYILPQSFLKHRLTNGDLKKENIRVFS